MLDLSLPLFTAATDAESARYRVLAGLQRARRAFTQFRVEPALARLSALQNDLRALLGGADRVDQSGPAVGVDWEAGRLVRAAPPAPLALDLARWALPRLEDAVGEGRALYAFAQEHAALDPVGLVPPYRSEGFLLVEDGGRPVRALRYRLSALTGADGRARGLQMEPVPVALDPLAPAPTWKAALAAAAPDLASPATFRLHADVALPVEETLVPVARAKLVSLVREWGEA